jgi:hypothetical protein
MKRAIAVLLALALITGAGLVQARGSGGGGHAGSGGGHVGGGGGHAGGGGGQFGGSHMGGGRPVMGRPVMGGGGHFVGHPSHPIGRPIVGVRPPVVVGRPFFPNHSHVVIGGAVVVGSPFFWWPAPYPYPYVAPTYGGDYTQSAPTYVEQGQVYYYCPDYQDYYPNVPTCPSPWVTVYPGENGSYYTN